MGNINAETVKMIRLANSLTQRQVAEMIGYTHGHIAAIETKTVPMTKRFTDKFIEAFNLDSETVHTADILRKLIVERSHR